jgi:two-component system cell cycle response regulator
LSFRLRLTLFFVLIVVLPMAALAVVVAQVASDSADGKTDARLDGGLRAATTLFAAAQDESREVATKTARGLVNDPSAMAALTGGSASALKPVADSIDSGDVESVTLSASGGGEARAGEADAIAASTVKLVDSAGDEVGTLSISTTTADEYVDQVESASGADVVLIGPSGQVRGSLGVDSSTLPRSGEAADFSQGGEDFRLAATEPLGAGQLRVGLLAHADGGGFFASSPSVAIALLAFFAIALIAAVTILRSLQGYVREMLGAARRIGSGDFSQRVPVDGGDEMAGLASEFNKMSERLGQQMDQLRRQRLEIENSVRRIGDAFASGLDRQALLGILVETAVGACDADYGLVVLSGHVGAEAETGKASEPVHAATLEAERRALTEAAPVEVSQEDAHAFATPLGRIGSSGDPVGTMTVGRADRPFTAAEREVFLYLVGQAAASVENIALHEMVSEQAVTDDLTGLANNRAFREQIDREAARALRFGLDLSLLILDLDNFKSVNDTYGHPQGDAVLRMIGRILREESRGIDQPARYGGEEFVVALPETDVEGALELAERIRERIEGAPVELVEGGGSMRITASVGLATLSGGDLDVRALIRAADAALYEAKRAGKNRVVVATNEPAEPAGSTQAKGPGRRWRK